MKVGKYSVSNTYSTIPEVALKVLYYSYLKKALGSVALGNYSFSEKQYTQLVYNYAKMLPYSEYKTRNRQMGWVGKLKLLTCKVGCIPHIELFNICV